MDAQRKKQRKGAGNDKFSISGRPLHRAVLAPPKMLNFAPFPGSPRALSERDGERYRVVTFLKNSYPAGWGGYLRYKALGAWHISNYQKDCRIAELQNRRIAESKTNKRNEMRSRFFTLSVRDILIGILMAFMTSILSGVIELLDNGAVFTWLAVRPILIAGLSAALSYLLKCLMTNSRDELFTREPKVVEG